MILHIFKKDVRRLWPQILVTLFLLGSLAWQDRWRSDWVPGSIEGWLNLLVPLAWACLIGLLIEQEPLVGDRQFWTTRPYRRGTLLAAKALFLTVFIHLPSVAANMYILTARGFSPFEQWQQLLWDQVVLAAALTLPAAALASLVRNFTHFILELIAVVAAMIFLSGSLASYRPPWEAVDVVRRWVAILVAAAAAIAILWIQYANRRPVLARVLGGAAAVVCGGLSAWLLPQSAFALRSAVKPASTELAMRLSAHGGQLYPGVALPENRVTVAIPIEISGVPESQGFWFDSLAAEVTGPGGDRYPAATRSTSRNLDKVVFDMYFMPYRPRQGVPQWLILKFDRPVFDRLRTGKARLTGQAGITLYRPGDTTWMPIGARQSASGVGLCATSLVGNRWSEDMLKVECESASRLPFGTRVRLWHPETGEDWNERLGSSTTVVGGPRTTWLSPLDRRQTFFRLADGSQRRYPGNRYLVPSEALATARIAITPEHLTGYAVLHYDFPDLPLSGYVVAPIGMR